MAAAPIAPNTLGLLLPKVEVLLFPTAVLSMGRGWTKPPLSTAVILSSS